MLNVVMLLVIVDLFGFGWNVDKVLINFIVGIVYWVLEEFIYCGVEWFYLFGYFMGGMVV